MSLCRRDGGTLPIVCLAAYLFPCLEHALDTIQTCELSSRIFVLVQAIDRTARSLNECWLCNHVAIRHAKGQRHGDVKLAQPPHIGSDSDHDEMRRANNGTAYTWSQFKAYYGRNGAAMWDATV